MSSDMWNWTRGNDITEFGGGFSGIVYVKILTTIDNKCYFSYYELRKKMNLKKKPYLILVITQWLMSQKTRHGSCWGPGLAVRLPAYSALFQGWGISQNTVIHEIASSRQTASIPWCLAGHRTPRGTITMWGMQAWHTTAGAQLGYVHISTPQPLHL